MRILAAAFTMFAVLAGAPASPASLSWGETATMDWTHAAMIAVHDGPAIYLIGDRDNLHIYNIAGNSWSKGTAPPLNQYGPAVTMNGKIYLLGGVTGPKITANCVVYDPATDKWSSIAPLPSARGAGAAAVLAGKIHLVGGRAYQGATLVDVNDHLVYDPVTNAWHSSTPMPTSRDGLALVADQSGSRLFAIGGFNEQTRNPSGKTEIYSLKTKAWSQGAQMPTPRFTSGSALVNGVIYILGGSTTTAMYSNVDAYTIAADHWKTIGGMPASRPLESAVAVSGTIYATGGDLCRASACYKTNKFWTLTP
ncbi:MAG: hypothetical protein JO219_03000 [Candidatus Eremiobacteraeota bacterium]|nr:hypothetical protein [Candidatus Eremiobacteraeota bacterium]MBV8364877.1 hypothetical protein [Candidatus Eremiobacteraeota bacterium]